jgi:hypothetical protein
VSWMWIVWALVIVGGFVLIEWYSFRRPDKQHTLSRAVWSLGQRWPLSIYIFGNVTGGLAVHFFWHWCPT